MDDGMDWNGLDYGMMPEEMRHALKIAARRRAKRARERAIADFMRRLRVALAGIFRRQISGRMPAAATSRSKSPAARCSE